MMTDWEEFIYANMSLSNTNPLIDFGQDYFNDKSLWKWNQQIIRNYDPYDDDCYFEFYQKFTGRMQYLLQYYNKGNWYINMEDYVNLLESHFKFSEDMILDLITLLEQALGFEKFVQFVQEEYVPWYSSTEKIVPNTTATYRIEDNIHKCTILNVKYSTSKIEPAYIPVYFEFIIRQQNMVNLTNQSKIFKERNNILHNGKQYTCNLFRNINFICESERLSYIYGRLRYLATMPPQDYDNHQLESSEMSTQFAVFLHKRLRRGPFKLGEWKIYKTHFNKFVHQQFPLLRKEQYSIIVNDFAKQCRINIQWIDNEITVWEKDFKTSYVESGLDIDEFNNLLTQKLDKCMEESAQLELRIQQSIAAKKSGHYHSHFCKCYNKFQGPVSLTKYIRKIGDDLHFPTLQSTLPKNTSVKECIQQHLTNYQASGETKSNPLVSSMASLLMDHLMKTITSTWQGITLVSGILASIVGTLISIIFAVIDIIRNGCNGLRLTSLICSFVSLLGQASAAVGAGCLLTQYPNITTILASLFGEIEDNTTMEELIDKLQNRESIPLIDQCLKQQEETSSHTKETVTAFAIASLVNRTTEVMMEVGVSVPKEFKPLTTPGDGNCGYHALKQGLSIRESIADIKTFLLNQPGFESFKTTLSVQEDANGFVNSEGWFNTDMIAPICRLFGITIIVKDQEGHTVAYKVAKPRKTMYLYHENAHFMLLQKPQKQGMPSIETLLSMGCGFIGLSLSIASMCGCEGVSKFNAEYIKSSRLRTALKSDISDAKELVEGIAEDVFGYQMNSHSKLKTKILDITNRMSHFLSQPNTYYAANPKEYFKYSNVMQEAEKLLTSCGTINSKMPNYLTSALSLLAADLARVKATFQELGKAILSGRTRQEPVPIMVVGRYGVGKTYFIRNFLIKELQKEFGWSDDVYSLNFSGQVYFKPYSGQEICFYDEFLAMKEEDPIIPHLNGICSIDQYNMPGAELWTKVQECLFNAFFLISNRHHCSLLNKLSTEAQEALYSRMNRIEIVNKSAPPTSDYTREQIKHSENYEEFEIRWYLKPASSSSPAVAKSPTKAGIDTRNLKDPYVIISKEELVKIIAQKIRVKHAQHHKLPKPDECGVLALQKPVEIPEEKQPGSDPAIPFDSVFKTNRLIRAAKRTPKKPEEDPKDIDMSTYETEVESEVDATVEEEQQKSNSSSRRGSLDWTPDQWKTFTQELIVEILMDQKRSDLPDDVLEIVYYTLDLEKNVNLAKTLVDVFLKFYPEYKEKEEIKEFLQVFGEELPEEQADTISTNGRVDNLVLQLSGQTDTGKSVLATDLAFELNKLLRLPIINITTQKLLSVMIETPTIIVLHDKMDNEQDYIQFYDSLPKPSIIINTNNLRFGSTWTIGCREKEADHTSSLLDSIVFKVTNTIASFRKCITILPHSSCTPEPGFARRIGCHGYIAHADSQHYRSDEVSEWYNVKRYGRLVTPDGKNEITKVTLLERMVSKYVALVNKVEGIKFEQCEVESLPADVELRFNNLDEAKKYVNNPCQILSLYTKFIKGNNTGSAPEIAISPRVINSTFVFNASMFTINDFEDVESVRTMAQNSYTLLMKANSEFTCMLSMGDFKAYCANQTIKYTVKGTLKDQLAVFSHRIYYDDDEKRNLLRLDEFKNNYTKEYEYSCDDIANLLVNGMQYVPHIPLRHASYLNTYKDQILSHKLMMGPKLKFAPKRILLKQITEDAPLFMRMWSAFKQSKWYTVLKVIIAIMVAITGIYALLSLAYLIYKWCRGSEVTTIKGADKMFFLYIGGKKCKCEATEAGSTVDVQVHGDQGIITMAGELLEPAVKEIYGEDYELGTIKYVHEQSNPKEQKNLKKKGKTLSNKPIQVIKNAVTGNQGQISDNQVSVMVKLYNAGCWVSGTRSNSYGLRWKNLDVITPAHLWNHSGEKGTVNIVQNIDGSLETITVPCLVHFVDHDNDIAFVRLQDSSGRGGRNTIALAPDLTKYFIKEQHIDAVSSAALLARAVQPSIRPWAFRDATPLIMAGYGQVHQLKANTDVDRDSRQLIFLRTQLLDILTRPGDCGSVYVCLDPFVDHNCILGLHSSLMPNGKESLGSVITQEYLASAIAMSTLGSQQQGVTMGQEINLSVIDTEAMELLPPNTTVYAKGHGMTPFYIKWYDALEPVEQEDKEIWYDAEDFPDANVKVVGYDKHHKPPHKGKPSHVKTPWSEELTSIVPNGKWLSVVDSKKHSDPDSLMTLKGRPSVLATQLHKYNDPVPKGGTFEKLLQVGKECLYNDCKSKYAGHLRILTDLEAINGTYINPRDGLYGSLEPMDLDSSSGDYPIRKWGVTNKKPLFHKLPQTSPTGKDLYNWDNTYRATDVRYSAMNVEYWALQGIRVLIPMKDCLKFEIVEKQDKSRLFTSLSIEEVLLGRKYTGALQGRVMQEHLKAHTQVGISPFPGFHSLYERFLKTSMYGEAGDFSRWDKHLAKEVLYAAMMVCAQLYIDEIPDKKEEITNVYNVMADTLLNSLSIADGFVYFKNRGMPSGCPITAMMNSFANDIMMYMCLYQLSEQHNLDLTTLTTEEYCLKYFPKGSPFEEMKSKQPRVNFSMKWVQENFDWVTYGDDFMSVISTKYLWLVNFMTRKKFYKEVVGMDYDSPAKDGTEIWYDNISNLSFISRIFRREAGMTFAALKKVTIESLLHWARTPSNKQYEDNIKDALWESVAWGEQYYNYICNAVHFIVLWGKARGIQLNVAISPWNIALQEMISKITISTLPVLPEQERRGVIRRQYNPGNGLISDQAKLIDKINEHEDFEATITKAITTQFVKQRTAQAMDDKMQLLTSIYEIVGKCDFSQCKELTKQYNFPALITDKGGITVSICFSGKTYKMFDFVQSDIQKHLALPLNGLCTFKKVTVCERSLDGGKSITPIWQCQFLPTSEIPSGSGLKPTYKLKIPAEVEKKERNFQKKRQAQASGTQERAPIQDGKGKHPDGETPLNIYATKGVPKSQIKTAIWERDIAQIKSDFMETPDSPMAIAINTPPHTVVLRRALNDMRNMPPGMRIWAMAHSSTNASRIIKVKFVTAATIINELVIGIAAQLKTTYTIQELQLIEWDAINPQDLSVEIELKLANVEWSGYPNVNMNRYTLVEYSGSQGTDTNPINMPTLVVMTRVGIQNSYANPDLSIQMVIQERFGEGHFLVNAAKLASGFPASAITPGYSSNVILPLSEWINEEKGKPFNITCDGGALTNEISLYPEDNESRVAKTGMCSLIGYWARRNNTQDPPELRAGVRISMSAKCYCLPLYNLKTESITVGQTKIVMRGWESPAVNQENVFDPDLVMYNNMAFNKQIADGSPLVANTTVFPSPTSPRYIIVAHSLNGAAVHPIENFSEDMLDTGLDFNYLVFKEGLSPSQILLNAVDTMSYYGDRVVTILPAASITYTAFKTHVFVNRDDASINTQGPFRVNDYVKGQIFETVQPKASVLLEYFNKITHQTCRVLMSLVDSTYADVKVPNTIYQACRMEGTMSFYARDLDDTNWIGPSFGLQMSTNFSLDTDVQLLVGLVNEVKRNLTHSLDPNFSRLTFPLTTPKTIPAALAESHTPVEYDDSGFIHSFKRKLTTSGIHPTDNEIVLFNLNAIVGGSVTMVVAFDHLYNTFFINNNPQSTADYYKSFRKLTYEDVGISQVRVINRVSGAIPSTITTNWINRVVQPEQESTVFTGRSLINMRSIGPNGSTRTHFRRTRRAQAEEAAFAATGFASQIFSSIFSYLSKKKLMDQQIANDLAKLQKQFENAEKLQNQKFEQQLELQGLKAESIKSTATTNFAPPASIQEPNNDYGLTFDSSGKVIQPSTTTPQASPSSDLDQDQAASPLSSAAVSPVASTSYDNRANGSDWSIAMEGTPKPARWLKPINTEERLSRGGTIHIGKTERSYPWKGNSMSFIKTR